jgi:hypothetical protein
METLFMTGNATNVTRRCYRCHSLPKVTSVHRYDRSKRLSGEKGPPLVVVADCLVGRFQVETVPYLHVWFILISVHDLRRRKNCKLTLQFRICVSFDV